MFDLCRNQVVGFSASGTMVENGLNGQLQRASGYQETTGARMLG